MTKKARKIILNTLAIVAMLAVCVWVASRFVHFGNVEYTDNAQIRRNLIPVNSRVQGYVREVRFDDYQFVHKGDTLVIIDDSEYALQLSQANAAVEKAKMESSAIGAAISTTESNVAVTDATIEEMRVRMEQAKTDYLRYKTLYEQEAVTREQFEKMQTEYEATKARYEMLSRQKEATASIRKEQSQRREQNVSNIESAEAARDLAKLNLSYTVITAPCDGVTSKRAIQPGQLIQSGQTLLSVVEQNKVWVVANYKEKQTKHIAEGMPVRIEVDAVPGVIYSGVVCQISNATGAQFSVVPQDNASGNFVKVQQRIPVKITFTDSNRREDLDRLRSDMNVTCEVEY